MRSEIILSRVWGAGIWNERKVRRLLAAEKNVLEQYEPSKLRLSRTIKGMML